QHCTRGDEVIELHAATRELDRLATHADRRATHAPFANELRNDELRRADRHGETDALCAADDRGVDAHDFTPRVNERSARVAGIERGVGLDDGVDDATGLRAHRA